MADTAPIVDTKPRAGRPSHPARFRKPRAAPKAKGPPNLTVATNGDAKPDSVASVGPRPIAEGQVMEEGEQVSKDSRPKRAPKRKGKGTKAAKAERDAIHLAVVLDAARTAVATYAKVGVSCSTFGSLACKLYGSARCPKDVDLLVYQPTEGEQWTAERLKKTLLDLDPVHFYLTMPKDPTAEYRVLWFRQYYLGPGCKVDVLLPGTMHLPNIPPSSAIVIDGVPLVPFSLLLLHKLQGWDDHRIAEEAHKRRKLPQDAGDIKRLLGMEDKVGELGDARPWSDRSLFSEEFEELTRRRVKDYCEAYPQHVKRWRVLGFEVPDPLPKPEKGVADEGKQEGAGELEEAEEDLELDDDEDEDEAKAEVEEEKLVEQLGKISLGANAYLRNEPLSPSPKPEKVEADEGKQEGAEELEEVEVDLELDDDEDEDEAKAGIEEESLVEHAEDGKSGGRCLVREGSRFLFPFVIEAVSSPQRTSLSFSHAAAYWRSKGTRRLEEKP